MSSVLPYLGLYRVRLFWIIISRISRIICFLTDKRSSVSHSLMIFPLLHSSLHFSLLLYTRMLNNCLCLNRSGDEASKWYKACCPYELPYLHFAGDRSIGNSNSMLIATTDWSMPVPYTRPAFQSYSAKNTPCNHWWRLPLSAEFIFCTLFKCLWKPSFIISFWLYLEPKCTGISKIYWEVFLNIPEKLPSSSTTIIFGSPNITKHFPEAHHAA